MVYDPVRGVVHWLNPTAALIWASVDGKTSVDRVARRMTKRFRLDPVEARSNVESLVTSFELQGLLGPRPLPVGPIEGQETDQEPKYEAVVPNF